MSVSAGEPAVEDVDALPSFSTSPAPSLISPLRAVHEYLPLMIWTTDATLAITSMSVHPSLDRRAPAPIRRSGAGPPMVDVTRPRHPDVAAHLTARRGFTVAWRSDGTPPLFACVGPLTAGSGEIEGVAGVAIVAEGYRGAAAGAPGSAAQWDRAVLSTAPVGIAVLTVTGCLVHANPSFCRLTAYSGSALQGLDIVELFAPEHAPLHERRWNELLAGERTRYHMVANLVRRDRRRVSVRISVWPMADDGTHRRHFLCVVESVGRDTPAAETANRQSCPELSAIQARLLEGLARGVTRRSICEALGMSRQGLDYHVKQLGRLLRAPNPRAIVATAYAAGVLHPADWPPVVRAVRRDPVR